MEIYKIKAQTHYRFLKSILLYIVLTAVGMPIISYFRKGYVDWEASMTGGLWGLVLLVTPAVLMHFNYYSTNKNMVVYYEESKKQLRVSDKDRDVTFTMSDIESVKDFKTYPKAENRTTWFPWDEYHYSLVELKNGEKFYFTSLILPNLDLPIDKSKITLKKRFYPAIW